MERMPIDDEVRRLRGDITRLFHEAQGLLDRLERLESELPSRDAVGSTPSRPAAARNTPVLAQVIEVIPPSPPAVIAASASSTPGGSPFGGAAAYPPPPLAAASRPPRAITVGKPAGASWEAVVGGRWMTWIGASILILAVGFAVHFAWTRLQTPEWIKAGAFHLLGIGILAAGFVAARRKLPVLAQGLAGLGIFTLYAAAFGLLHFYHVMVGHEPLVFVECLLITALAIVVAVRANSVAIVLLGALGGYLTPVLTSTGSGNYVALFVYLAFLNLALSGCAVWRGWSFLKLLTLFATAVMFAVWITGSQFDEATQRWPLQWLVTLHAVILLAAGTIPPLAWKRTSRPEDLIALSANAMWYMSMTWWLFHDSPTRQLALVGWGLALLHLILFFVTRARVTHADRMPRVQLALAAVFFTLAAPLQLEDASLYWGVTWCVQGLIFTAVGLYFRDTQMRISALLVFGVAAIRLLLWDYLLADPQPLGAAAIDARFLVMTAAAALIAGAGSLYWVIPTGMAWADDDPLRRSPVGPALLAAANLVLLLAVTCQWSGRTVLVLWTIDAALLWAAGFLLDRHALRWYACVIGVALVGGRMLYHNFSVDPDAAVLFNARFVSLALVAAMYFAAGWQYRRMAKGTALLGRLTGSDAVAAAHKDEAWLDPFLGILANITLLTAISLEIDLRFDLWRAAGHSPFTDMRMAEMAAYSIVWALYAAGLVAAGFLLRYKLFRLIGLACFVPILLKVFFVDLAHLQLIIRVLALAVVGMALLGVSFLYQRYAPRLLER
jgi:uncharacterized membrane protein